MTRYACTRCNRRLKAPTPSGMGPVCLRAVTGTKPRKEKREVKRDQLTRDMFRVEFDESAAMAGEIFG